MNASDEIQEALLEALMGLDDDADRREMLGLLRDGDPDRSERLAEMLSLRSSAERFFREAEEARTRLAMAAGSELLEEAPVRADGPSEEAGTEIGRYRLLERIGEGGWGIVYLAEQRQPVRRRVALKIVRPGMDTEQVIARFEIERQALAMMDHPNIARVFDAGTTDKGRPYFVMEWVKGLRVTDYCDTNRLGLRQRVDLFLEICKGIQHAHQKGVIHRDIKPSNILVTAEHGVAAPKVIDFGVAKAFEGPPADDAALTVNDQMLGTPAYMSPEQADQRVRDIDTRTDVHGLGVLLYELLAGRTPFDPEELAAAGVTGMRRILMERESPPPSAAFHAMDAEARERIAAARQSEPAALLAMLRGDLDLVVLKALEKDRRERYETVNAFMMDLQRCLAHEPVLARPRSRAYLFGKFVRRNRFAVGATGAIVVSLALGLGTASAFYLRERSAREEQSRLRRMAEAAHAGERQRLSESKEWENFAKVSMLLSEGKTAEADAQLRETPLESIQLSSQSAEVVRSLGNWNALRGRWHQAAECFMMLAKSDGKLPDEGMVSALDLLTTAPTLIESGRMEDYVRFQEWAVARFGDAPDLLSVERVLHTTLLAPAEPRFLRTLAPLVKRLEGSEFDPKRLEGAWPREAATWRALALAMLAYRLGEPARAQSWLVRAESFGVDRDYVRATIEPMTALIAWQAGDRAAAHAALKQSEQRLARAFDPELPAAYEPFGRYHGFWWDWGIARILAREARRQVDGVHETESIRKESNR